MRFESRAPGAFVAALTGILRRWRLMALAYGLGLVPLLAASPTTAVTFDIQADAASAALRLFAEQSGQQVIYPPQLLEGRQTAAVKGRYAPKEALERLLAGTPLTVWQDEQTGALAIGRAQRATGMIALPPFVVAEELPGWRHAAVPGYEFLSRCSDNTTAELIAQSYALRELLNLMVPRRLQFQSDVPSTYLFFKDSEQPPIAPALLSILRQRAWETTEKQLSHVKDVTAAPQVRALASYAFRDQDVDSTFCIWSDGKNGGFQLLLAPEYVRFLLSNRTPALPLWFIEGMMEVYRSVTMETLPRRNQGLWQERVQGALLDDGYSITFHPLPWVSGRLTEELRRNPQKHAELLPLADLFSDRPMTIDEWANDNLQASGAAQPTIPAWLARQFEYSDNLRLSEAALFIRWALETGKEPRRRALWAFVDQASRGPATESMFRECFGFDYRAAEALLRPYLGVAVAKSFQLRPERRPALDPIDFNDASIAEISRIKGDFNRLEIPFVRALYPALTEKYVEQARRTLGRSYAAGDRDPRLLAELGLCECDAGNDAAARPFLEAAVQAKVVRPRAYYELARLRMAAFRGDNPAARLTVSERDEVLAPLLAMRGQQPAIGEAYELMAEAWLRCSPPPDQSQLAVLEAGLALFPHRPRLIFSVALLDAARGRFDEARALVERGLSRTDDALLRIRLIELQGILSTQSPRRGP